MERPNKLQSIAIPLIAVLMALLIGAVIILISGSNPLAAYGALLEGAFGSAKGIARTLEKSTPLIFSGLAVAFAFKAGLFNIGGQGQLLFGALVAGIIGYAVSLPALLHIPLAVLGGCVAGGLYAGLSGWLKTQFGAHEVITTIMLNFIASNITDYVADGPLKDEGIIARLPQIQDSAVLPAIGPVPTGFLLAIVVVFITAWLLDKTTVGYEIQTVGKNPNAAKYAGMKVARTVVLTMFISGLLAGMGGAIETQGVVGRFQPGFNAGLGFEGITIAMLAKTNPYGVIPAALLVGAMQSGASQMQFDAKVAPEIIDVVLGLMLFLVSADMIIRRLIRARGDDDSQPRLSSGWGN